jgi:hypothetical protein
MSRPRFAPACAAAVAAGLVLAAALPARAQMTDLPPVRQDSLGAGLDSLPPQRDFGDVWRQITGRGHELGERQMAPRPGLDIVALPSVGYNPAYGFYVGLGASAGGWLGDPAITRLSVFTLNATYSTEGQLAVLFRSDAWIPGNDWNLKGDWRYLDTSQPTHGLGPTVEQVGKYPMEFQMWRLYETVYRQVSGPIYVGLGYHLNIHDEVLDERAAAGEVTPYTVYSGGPVGTTTSSGLSANILIDSRDSPIYATQGVLWNASIRSYQRPLGSDKDWQEIWSDFRAYPNIPFGSRHTLAIWNQVWLAYGEAPYLDLPAIGWDTYGKTGRGYVQGRLRASDQIYTEFEYRYTLTQDGLWGAVGFANFTISTLSSGAFGPLDPGYGFGLRMKFIKRTRTNLTVDFGWGNAASSGIYFGTQEYF